VAEINQFGSAKPARSSVGGGCAQCEAMLTDAVDGTLSAADQATFDRHIASCDVCSQMLADAQRGAALLEMLKADRPEPPSTLLERILLQTSGVQHGTRAANEARLHTQTQPQIPAAEASLPGFVPVGTPAPTAAQTTVPPAISTNLTLPALATVSPSLLSTGASSTSPLMPPALGSAKVLPFRARITATFNMRAIGHTLMQPRLAMTAAMAFFSIALTLNLTGVHLSEFRVSDLKPSNIKRSVYEADAHVVRYYENLRVVYELESRVHDLKHDDEDDSPAAPSSGSTNHPSAPPNGGKGTEERQKQSSPHPGSGSSQRQRPDQPAFKLVAVPARQNPGTLAQNTRTQVFASRKQEGGLV